MSLVDHLAELRRRVLISVAAFGVASVIGWFLEPRLLEVLVAPLRELTGEGLRFIGLGDAFAIRLRISLLFGLVTASEYFGFVTSLILAFGLVMQFPILLTFLAEAGIVNSGRLRSSRRYVILAIAVFAAVATPGGDLVSPAILGGVMYLLYELTIQFIRRRGH